MKKGLRQMLSICLAAALSIGTSVQVWAGFVDVSKEKWCFEAITWAVKEKIAVGTSADYFSPNETCTKAQVLTFLWRACGSPKIEIDNPFWDIDNSKYYYRAALWAYENGMQTGDYFEANVPCTRGMVVRYMWQVAGSPLQSTETQFYDVTRFENYTQAVVWAVNNGIAYGTTQDTFSPRDTCTRAQVMAFLYRGRDILENLDNSDADASDEDELPDEPNYDIFDYDEDDDDWDDADWDDSDDWDDDDWDDDTDWDDDDDWYNDSDDCDDWDDDDDDYYYDDLPINDADKQEDADDSEEYLDFWDIMSRVEVSDVYVDEEGTLKFNFRFT